jgi:hypothetical protein
MRDRPAAEAMLRELQNDLWLDRVRRPAGRRLTSI